MVAIQRFAREWCISPSLPNSQRSAKSCTLRKVRIKRKEYDNVRFYEAVRSPATELYGGHVCQEHNTRKDTERHHPRQNNAFAKRSASALFFLDRKVRTRGDIPRAACVSNIFLRMHFKKPYVRGALPCTL